MARLDISGQMIERLRWHALSPAEKARRWKTRPRETGADKRLDLGLVRRGLVDGDLLATHDGRPVLGEVRAISERGRAILKACRTKGPAAKKRPTRRELEREGA